MDDHKLEAVISLPGKAGSLFSGACILIFSKQAINTTHKVWFYRTAPDSFETNEDTNSIETYKNNLPGFAVNHRDARDIVSRWEINENKPGEETDKSFYVSVGEIRSNNYNLNFNEYGKVLKEQKLSARPKHASVAKQIIPGIKINKRPEPGIGKKPPVVLTAPAKKKLSIVAISLIISCVAALTLYFSYFTNPDEHVTYSAKKNNLSPDTRDNADTAHKTIPVSLPSEQEPEKPLPETTNLKSSADTTRKIMPVDVPSEQAAEKPLQQPARDSIANTQAQKKLRDLAAHVRDSARIAAKHRNDSTLASRKAVKTAVPDIPTPEATKKPTKEQFVVTSKAYFHSLPNESTRLNSYINHLSNAVLIPIDDRDGFIYIVYTDALGQTIKGWLNKNDLRQLQ